MGMAAIGDVVRIHYEGRLEDGTVFDSSYGGDPLEFTVGGEGLIKGVSFGVVGMAEGEKKDLTVPPEEGYGESHPDLVSEVPKASLPDDLTPERGMTLHARTESGQQFAVTVVDVKEDCIVVDANHPLAGKTLVFSVELVAITPQKTE